VNGRHGYMPDQRKPAALEIPPPCQCGATFGAKIHRTALTTLTREPVTASH
jgi:hypothetical protein